MKIYENLIFFTLWVNNYFQFQEITFYTFDRIYGGQMVSDWTGFHCIVIMLSKLELER